MARLLATTLLLLLLAPMTTAHAFTDVPSESWYAPYLEELVAMQVLSGNPDGSFGPGKHMTRAELAKIAVELGMISGTVTGQETLKEAPFRDIADNAWYTPYVQRAVAAGLLRGYMNQDGTPSGLFRPSGFVTRAEAVKVLLSATDISLDDAPEDPFRDTDPAAWYAPFLRSAYHLGIVDGYKNSKGTPTGTFGPADHVTRAQVAKMAVLALDPFAFGD